LVCEKRPLAIAAMNAELPLSKNGDHNSESASTIDHDITPLSHIHRCSEPATWLPDPCLDRDESDGSHHAPPTIVLCHTLSAFEAAGFGQDFPRNEIKGTL